MGSVLAVYAFYADGWLYDFASIYGTGKDACSDASTSGKAYILYMVWGLILLFSCLITCLILAYKYPLFCWA